MLKERTATLCVFDKVEVKQLDYCNAFVRTCLIDGLIERVELVSYCTPVIAIDYGNGLRVMIEPNYKVYGLHDVEHLFDVRYESVKPFKRY